MTQAERDFYGPEVLAVADFFRIISHQSRIEIVRILMQEGPKSVEELEAMLLLSPSFIDHHLMIFRVRDLLTVEEHMGIYRYALKTERFFEIQNKAREFIKKLIEGPEGRRGGFC